MNKATQDITVKLRDHVTFDTDEGIQTGFVNGLRRDIGNGELYAWIELDHQWPGIFHAVPVSAILTTDQVEPRTVNYFGFDGGRDAVEHTRLCCCNLEVLENRSEEGRQ
ncbi:hypothetical protein GN109_01675 [Collimonas pratensis]|uniref:hypothetical protein n=1 Tax=Collimonas pratensis TaxID=279113 RepID=UPI00143DC4D4|nr:hypothetical protein [Collimonas pratensis]NKI68115.1 hypothetical protein [Collimonas pratensis]